MATKRAGSRRWPPKTFRRFVRTVTTSSLPALIETDSGLAYLKAMNNPEGPHILACEWIGTRLARKFGLPTFDTAILTITDLDEISLRRDLLASRGPAFVTRNEAGQSLDGPKALKAVENIGELARIVVFDTWLRNCDRYAPGMGKGGKPRINMKNLFLSQEQAAPGRFVLKPIDHGHILTCGRELTPKIAQMATVHEEKLYGLFPMFKPFLKVDDFDPLLAELAGVNEDMWKDLLRDVPDEWGISDPVRSAIGEFLLQRARFLAGTMKRWVQAQIDPQIKLNYDQSTGGEP